MRIILKKDVEKIGKKGEEKQVSPGYARNYLIPGGLAIVATEQAIKDASIKQKRQQEEKGKVAQEAEKIIKKISDKSVSIRQKATEDGKLYGRPTADEIAKKINKKLGVNIKPKHLKIDDIDLKKLGDFEIPVVFDQHLTAKIKLSIIKE